MDLVTLAAILKKHWGPEAMRATRSYLDTLSSLDYSHQLGEITYHRWSTLTGRLRASYRLRGDTPALTKWVECFKESESLQGTTLYDIVLGRRHR